MRTITWYPRLNAVMELARKESVQKNKLGGLGEKTPAERMRDGERQSSAEQEKEQAGGQEPNQRLLTGQLN